MKYSREYLTELALQLRLRVIRLFDAMDVNSHRTGDIDIIAKTVGLAVDDVEVILEDIRRLK